MLFSGSCELSVRERMCVCVMMYMQTEVLNNELHNIQ